MNLKTMTIGLAGLVFLSFPSLSAAPLLEGLEAGSKVADFTAQSVYLDFKQSPVGARFRHQPTGLDLYLLQIETVPQAHVWVKTQLETDAGEPHTLEHILVSKSTQGKRLNVLEQRLLGDSNAFTTDIGTYYTFYSTAGMPAFYEQIQATFEALTRMDVLDEQIAREVFHFGVQKDPVTGQLDLVEKGGVYNEMVSHDRKYDDTDVLSVNLFGKGHPYTKDVGGLPSEIRRLQPKTIRAYHERYYSLGNMGMIVVLPPSADKQGFLTKLSTQFATLPQRPVYDYKLPALRPTKARPIQIVPVAAASASDEARVAFAWDPLTDDIPVEDGILMELFMSIFGGGTTSMLHKSLIDRQHRQVETPFTGSYCYVESDSLPYQYGICRFGGAISSNLKKSNIETVRKHVLGKLKEVANYKDGSDEVKQFNEKALTRIVASERSVKLMATSAPYFGFRNTARQWWFHLPVVEKQQSFRKSLTLTGSLQSVRQSLQTNKNIWRPVINRMQLLTTPITVASKASPSLHAQLEKQKRDRKGAKLDRLKAQYKVKDGAAAVAAFAQDYNKTTEKIAAFDQNFEKPPFGRSVPRSRDDQITYVRRKFAHRVPVTMAFFNTPKTDIHMAFDLKRVPKEYWVYLPLLPATFSSLGLKEGDKVTGYQEFFEEVAREILDLGVHLGTNLSSNRYELHFDASVSSREEWSKALDYIKRLSSSSNLSYDNINRLRDIVASNLSTGRNFTRGPGDYWASNVASYVRVQKYPLWMSLESTFTKHHYFNRLKWLLMDPPKEKRLAALDDGKRAAFGPIGGFIDGLNSSDGPTTRQQWNEQLMQLASKGDELGKIAAYLKDRLWEIPDATLLQDIRALAEDAFINWTTDPKKVLKDLRDLQKLVLNRYYMTIELVGEKEMLKSVRGDVKDLIYSYGKSRRGIEDLKDEPLVIANLKSRYPEAKLDYPFYAGFVNPSSTNGEIVVSAYGPSFRSYNSSDVYEFLGAKLFSGATEHGLFMRTIEAGLAYSNGLSNSLGSGSVRWVAYRSPNIRATTLFMESVVQDFSVLEDKELADDLLSATFSGLSRQAEAFSSRGIALAEDLKDGFSPKRIRRFTGKILKLKEDPQFVEKLKEAAVQPLSKVRLVTGDKKLQEESKATFFYAGPESQLQEIEKDIKDAPLYRIWPRDFWITEKVTY